VHLWRGGWSYESFGEEFINGFVQCGKFDFQHRIYRSSQYLSTFFDIRFDVICAMWWEVASCSTSEDIMEFMVFLRELSCKCLSLGFGDQVR
jgi:hypothetical protein